DASSPTATPKPIRVPFDAGLGPNTVVALRIGGEGSTGLDDLYVGSIYNSPDLYQAFLLRNSAGHFTKIAEEPLTAPVIRGTRLALKSGGPEAVCVIVHEEKGDELH